MSLPAAYAARAKFKIAAAVIRINAILENATQAQVAFYHLRQKMSRYVCFPFKKIAAPTLLKELCPDFYWSRAAAMRHKHICIILKK